MDGGLRIGRIGIVLGAAWAASGGATAAGDGDCPTYHALRVTPPNVTGAVTLHASLTVCAPQVHPIIAGSTGRTPPPPVN